MVQSNTTPDPENHMEKWQSIIKHHIQESQEVDPFPGGVHKAAMNRQKKTRQTWNINNKSDPQKKHRLGTVSKITFTEGLKLVSWC